MERSQGTEIPFAKPPNLWRQEKTRLYLKYLNWSFREWIQLKIRVVLDNSIYHQNQWELYQGIRLDQQYWKHNLILEQYLKEVLRLRSVIWTALPYYIQLYLCKPGVLAQPQTDWWPQPSPPPEKIVSFGYC